MNEQKELSKDLGSVAKKAGSRLLKNIFLIILQLAIVVGVVVLLYEIGLRKMKVVLMIGIGVEIIYGLMILFSKKLRSPYTIWLAFVAFAAAAWWVYLLTKTL